MEQQWNDVSVKHVNNVKLLRQVRSKQMRSRREVLARRAELEQLARQEPGRQCFRAVGKSFVVAPREALEQEATAGAAEGAAAMEKYEKQAQFLMAKVRENEMQMGELMRASGQK
jgi:hypothetical protein